MRTTKRILGGLVVASMLVAGSANAEGTHVEHAAVASGSNFVPAALVIQAGDTLSFTNLDASMHSLTSVAVKPNTSKPLFTTPLLGLRESASVAGVEDLLPSTEGYLFTCVFHAGMKGTLYVVSVDIER